MSKIRVSKKIQQSIFVATAVAVAISAGMAWATPGGGSSSTLLGRGTFDEAFKVKREFPGVRDWEVEVEAKPALDVATQIITFSLAVTVAGTVIQARSSFL